MSECGVVIITVRSFRPRILSFGFGQILALTFLAPLALERKAQTEMLLYNPRVLLNAIHGLN